MQTLATLNMVEKHNAEMLLYVDNNYKRKQARSDSQGPLSHPVILSHKRTNASTGRAAASTGTVLVRLCETEQRREASSLPHLKKMLTTRRDHGGSVTDGMSNGLDSERLPVVELRPFVQKQWRPAKSIPSPTYSDPPPFIPPMMPVNNYMQRSKTDIVGAETGHVAEPERPSFSVKPQEAPCPRAFSVAGERLSSHPKSRETHTLHHSASISAHGFASKVERERSTMEDIRNGSGLSIFNYAHGTPREPEIEASNIHVNGTRIDCPLRESPFYQRPWEYYKKLSNARNNDEAELLESLYRTLGQMPNTYLDESIYDAFDRSHTLTSINVHPASMRRRSEKTRLPSNVDQPHRLGVTNSLDLLSHYGSPINMEQHLNIQLKNTLNGIRRTKPLSISSLRAVKNSEWNLTQGEQQIYTRRLANTSCSTRSSSRVFSSSKRGDAMSRRTLPEQYLDLPEQASPTEIEVRKSKLHNSKTSIKAGSEVGDVKEKVKPVHEELEDSVRMEKPDYEPVVIVADEADATAVCEELTRESTED